MVTMTARPLGDSLSPTETPERGRWVGESWVETEGGWVVRRRRKLSRTAPWWFSEKSE